VLVAVGKHPEGAEEVGGGDSALDMTVVRQSEDRRWCRSAVRACDEKSLQCVIAHNRRWNHSKISNSNRSHASLG
jgi:uncharacterized protein YhbP (UPF0306 family)